MRRRILYLSRSFGFPLGGVRIAYEHVAMLQRQGFDASILLVTNDDSQFFEADVPVLRLGNRFEALQGDVFVVPEPWHNSLLALKSTSARKVVFCQNPFYVFLGLGDARSYADLGVSTVFCCGDVVAEYLKKVLTLADVPVVHNGINHTLASVGGAPLV